MLAHLQAVTMGSVRAQERADLLRAHLALLGQADLTGVLGTLAAAGQRLAGRAVAGCLLRDAGLDAWHLTALVDDAGRPLDLMELGVTTHPFPFRLPDTSARV